MTSLTRAYRGQIVLVVGLGVTGRAVAAALTAAGATVRAADRRSAAELGDVQAWLGEGAVVYRDDDVKGCLDGVSLVVPSPGVASDAPLLAAAVARGIPVVSELELAARHLGAPILAVTGTNGKSTTTALLGEMLRAADAAPFVGGNLGTPLIAALQGRCGVAVVEVSSFQLEWIEEFRPRVGVLLNVTEDHLDRYPDLDAYGRTKLRMFAAQGAGDVAVLNGDDPWIRAHAAEVGVRQAGAAAREGRHAEAARQVWFGAGADATVSASPTEIRAGTEAYALADARLVGAHNRENMMAAVAAAQAFDVPRAAVQAGLERFQGLEHRLELVRERGGVRWFNDSKGTNPAAVVRSLQSFPGRVILLAGGIEKGGDYGVLATPAAGVVTRAIVFGAAQAMLARTFAGVTTVERATSLAEAVARADAVAVAGDTVLLSPACASFDMFRDYADRGRQFKALVEAL